MEYSYRFRIYPNREQRIQIAKTFGCTRYVYNHFLAQRMEACQTSGKMPTQYEQSKMLTVLKDELPWLREADSTSLQAALQNLEKAYQNFFRQVRNGEKPGHPKFKSRKSRQSYRTKCGTGNIRVTETHVRLPKLGMVKCRVSREIKGRILSATVSQTPGGSYYVCLCCTGVELEQKPSTGEAVGVDLGLRSLACTTDGVRYPNLEYLEKDRKKLARLQRALSRKTFGSAKIEN